MPTIKVYKSDNSTKNYRPIYRKYEKKPYNFMKWYRVVRYWVKRKYDVDNNDLEIMLYLYDHDLFTRGEFRRFEGIMSWDKKRFDRFLERGYIVLWRDHKSYSRQAKLYTLSVGMKRMCDLVYKKLAGVEPISEKHVNNPIFKGDRYMDKVYRRAIKRMNKEFERIRKEEEMAKARQKKEG